MPEKPLLALAEQALITANSNSSFAEMKRVDADTADRLEADLRVLSDALAPSDPKAWAAVLYRLAVLPSRAIIAMEEDEDVKLMIADMSQALAGAIPSDLVEMTRYRAMQTCTFFPSPAELIALVKPEISERTLMLNTARMMLTKAGRTVQ